MPRFFKEKFKEYPFIEGDDAVHIAKSLRMRVGEKITVCDSKGTEFDCVIKSLSKNRVDMDILKETTGQTEPDISVTLCTCLLKGDKFERVIRHSVELGV